MKLIERGGHCFELQGTNDGDQVTINVRGLKIVVEVDYESPTLSVCSNRDAVLPVYDGSGEELCFIPVLRSSRDG